MFNIRNQPWKNITRCPWVRRFVLVTCTSSKIVTRKTLTLYNGPGDDSRRTHNRVTERCRPISAYDTSRDTGSLLWLWSSSIFCLTGRLVFVKGVLGKTTGNHCLESYGIVVHRHTSDITSRRDRRFTPLHSFMTGCSIFVPRYNLKILPKTFLGGVDPSHGT